MASLADLRRWLARGMTLRTAAALTNRPLTSLWRLAAGHQLKRRRRGLSPEKRALLKRLVAAGYGGRRLARAAGVSSRTAWAYQYLHRLRQLDQRLKTPRPCRPWRCPVGGELINLTVCIAHGTRKPAKAPKRGPRKIHRSGG